MNKAEQLTENMSLLLSDAHGQYIPQIFVEDFYTDNPNHHLVDEDGKKIGTDKEHGFIIECLDDASNSENEFYWDGWESILNNVHIVDEEGKLFMLYQNGNLWAIPVAELEELTEEEKDEFWELMLY